MPTIEIPTNEVDIGMFVASLDRPWSETPFLFQGFEVHGQNDIDELKRLTKHVYIMVPDEEIVLTPLPNDHSNKILTSERVNTVNYSDMVPASEEVKRVLESHEVVSNIICEVELLLKSENRLQIELIKEPVRKMVDSIVKNPDAYLWLTRIRKFDSFLYNDALTSAVWGAALGRKLGLPEEDLQVLAMGCMLMDIGKLSLPTELLHKHTRLDHDDWELMKSHVDHGIKTLMSDDHCKPAVLDIVRTHHERIDGSGYPAGLHSSQIPLFGQIAGIVDQYVAVTNPRPFSKPISASMAETMLYEQKNRLFEEDLVEYFIQTLGTYPTGTLVEMSSGEVGAVIAQNPRLHLKPDVVLLLDMNKHRYDIYAVVSLASYCKDDKPVTIIKTLVNGDYNLNIEEISFY